MKNVVYNKGVSIMNHVVFSIKGVNFHTESISPAQIKVKQKLTQNG